MFGLSDILGVVPAPLQTFILPAVVCGYIYYVFREKQTERDNRQRAWADGNSASIREDNDRQSGRIGELENTLAMVRQTYEATIDRIRQDMNRGWDLARDWCAVAHEQRHWMNNKLMLVPEDKRPEPLPPLPGLERRAGFPADQFPPRFLAE